MNRAPFPPLVANPEGLDVRPPAPSSLHRRMAELYGVPEACVLPVRDAIHGVELAFRALASTQAKSIAGELSADAAHLARIYGLAATNDETRAGLVIVSGLGEAEIIGLAGRLAPALVCVDESYIEFAETPSLASCAASGGNILVLRSLSYAYGLAGAPCGAAIASPAVLARLQRVMEPYPLPTPVTRLAEAALDPSRLPQTLARIDFVKRERARLAAGLAAADGVLRAEPGAGPFVMLETRDAAARAALRQFGVAHDIAPDDRLRVLVSSRAANDRSLAALGIASATAARRVAEIVRDTKETRIAVAVDLDAPGPARIDSGIGFFDHMLAQVAQHGGFSLTLTCRGDLEIDAHHSIEDCALAFGQALSQALGERRGIARFGFLLPMDETEARVSIDLGGRPYTMFEGAFDSALLGEYPTQMTAHVFRSLAQSLGAAVHVSVTGGDDHHKTEACFKAFGRALRQAIRVEGDAIPSTKGVL